MAKTCTRDGCERGTYGEFCLMHKPRKAIVTNKRPARQSAKELVYQDYKETVLRPALIARDGNTCSCCTVTYPLAHKLDIEHTLTKGSRPDLKRDLGNLTLMCRMPCHDNKTAGRPCLHV